MNGLLKKMLKAVVFSSAVASRLSAGFRKKSASGAWLLAMISLSGAQAFGGPAGVRLAVDLSHPGPTIPENFIGLSYEAASILPDADGHYYFSPTNAALVRVFHTLGIKSLRIGGNSSDRDAVTLPSEADLESLFAFARVAGVKVIYCLRLHHGNPAAAAKTAKFIYDRYADVLDCFSIGQEPSAYPVAAVDDRPASERMGANAEHYSYQTYRDQWKQFSAAILNEVPPATFAGPGVHNDASWIKRFVADFGRSNQVALLTAHLYPGGAGGKVPTPEIGRNRMLSGEFFKVYQRLLDGSLPAIRSSALPYRLEEVNSFYNGGAKGVSDSFASALWGLEFLHWWASHGAAGINFHTGDRVAAGANLFPAKYSAITSVINGYEVRPLGYGIQMFGLAGHGRYVPVKLEPVACTNLSIFATLNQDRTLFVAVINKSHGGDAQAAEVSLPVNGYQTGKMIRLSAPAGDVAAQSGVSLGGGEIGIRGSWNGIWNPLAPLAQGGFQFVVPAASAVVVEFTTGSKVISNLKE